MSDWIKNKEGQARLLRALIDGEKVRLLGEAPLQEIPPEWSARFLDTVRVASIETLKAELEVERKARQEAEARVSDLVDTLHAILSVGANVTAVESLARDAIEQHGDTGKQYLAIVEAAREYVEAERELMAIFDGPDTDKVIELERKRNELHDELMRAVGGDSQ